MHKSKHEHARKVNAVGLDDVLRVDAVQFRLAHFLHGSLELLTRFLGKVIVASSCHMLRLDIPARLRPETLAFHHPDRNETLEGLGAWQKPLAVQEMRD
jgi:hypothetical protein